MLEQIGNLIWKTNPEGGIVIFGLFIITVVWIIFYRKSKFF